MLRLAEANRAIVAALAKARELAHRRRSSDIKNRLGQLVACELKSQSKNNNPCP